VSVASYIERAYDETYARIRKHLCDEIPHGQIHKGERPTPRMDLDAHADWVTRVALRAQGFNVEDQSRAAPDTDNSPGSK
jgi:hypothetical protein